MNFLAMFGPSFYAKPYTAELHVTARSRDLTVFDGKHTVTH